MGNVIGIAALAYQLSQAVIISLLVSFSVGFHVPIIARVGSHWQALSSLPGLSEIRNLDCFCQKLVRESPQCLREQQGIIFLITASLNSSE